MQSTMFLLRINIKRITKLLVLTLVITMLSSCATVTSHNISSDAKFDTKSLTPKLASITKWEAKGVIGIIHDNDADSASYVYIQNGDTFNIKLYGPMGIGSVEIFGSDNKVTLKTSDGKSTQSSDIKSLMMQQLGWYVPVDGLKYWIKSTVVPGNEFKVQKNTNNLPSEISQDGWDIKYKNYKLVDNKYPLATNIKMKRKNMSIKIIIKEWQL